MKFSSCTLWQEACAFQITVTRIYPNNERSLGSACYLWLVADLKIGI